MAAITQYQKEAIAWEYYVEHLTTAEIAQRYKRTRSSISLYLQELRGAFRDAIIADYSQNEDRCQQALAARREGMRWREIQIQYNITRCSTEGRRIAELEQSGEEGDIISPPGFTPAELRMEKLYVIGHKTLIQSNRKPLFGIYNRYTGRWVAKVKDGEIKPAIFRTQKAANRFLKPYHPNSETLKVRIYGWVRELRPHPME